MPKGRRGYYKQPASIWREGWPIEIVGALTNLQGYLQDRWARDGIPDEEAGRAVISMGNLLAITGTDSPARALARLSGCSQRVTMAVTPLDHRRTRKGSEVPTRVLVDWPKFSRYQHNLGEFARESPAKEGLRVQRPASSVKRPQREEPREAVEFAASFLDGLQAVHSGFKGPASMRTWQRAARLMLSSDGRPLAEAQALARWLFEDPGADAAFWRPNVLGVPKFRKQYDQLQAVRRRTSNGAARNTSTVQGPLEQASRRIARQIELGAS